MRETFVAFSVCALVLVGFCVFGLLLAWLFGRLKRSIERATQPPVDFCAAVRNAGGREFGEGFVVTREGAEYFFKYIHNSEGPSEIRASRSIVAVGGWDALPELPAVTLREETKRDRLGKALRLNRELQTGDALFDDRVYIECDSSKGAAQIMAIPEVRGGVVGLLAAGYGRVGFRLHGHALVASWHEGVRTFNPQVVEQTINGLAQIADALPPFRSVSNDRRLTTGAKAMWISWLLTVLAFAACMVAESRWEPLGGGLAPLTMQIMVLLFALHVTVMWMLARGCSQALRNLAWGALAGLMLAPCLSRAALVTYNGAGDEAITTYPRRLDHMNADTHDDSPSYYLHFAAVPGMRDSSARISVSRREYALAHVGDDYLLTTGAGKLGVPWLRELERAPSEP